jgi:predicted transcriptional regulator
MLTSSRPLLDTKADAAYFVNRSAELGSLRGAVDLQLNSLVLGSWGSGKTSLVRHLAYRLGEERIYRVEVVDGAIAPEPLDLLSLLTERLLGPELVARVPAATQGPWGYEVAARSRNGQLLALVDRLRRELPRELAQPPRDADGPAWEPDNSLILCIDGATPSAVHTLFGSLRDELWSLPIVWVVTGDEASAAAYLKPPVDAFFEVVLTLPPFDVQDAMALLTARVDGSAELDAATLQRLVTNLDERTPRALVTTMREILADSSRPAEAVELATERRNELLARLTRLGRGAAMLVAELQARGGSASASDKDLLDALGWTRPRAAQVLRQLEEAGLVTSSELRGDGRGRPRKVYSLREPVL